MPNEVTQLALVTAAMAARMENTMVASKLVEWKQNDKNLTPLNGFEYIEQAPPRYNRRKWTGAVADLTAGKQDTVFGSEIFQLNSGDTLDFYYADFENIRDFDSARKNARIRSIGQNEGQLVDADVLGTASLAGSNWIGTPGNPITDVEAILSGYARLLENGVPDVESDVFCVLPHTDKPALAKYLQELAGPDIFTTDMVVKARIKELGGLPVLFTQQLPVLTTGTRVAGAVNGAGQNRNYRDVCRSTTANGQFMTQLISVDGLGANATVKDGEILELTGVNAYDNRKQASQGRRQQFRVVGDHTATAGGAIADLRIFPAIIIPGGAVTGDTGVNTANATCTAAPADDAPIIWIGNASTDYLQRAIIKRTAVRVETATLEELPSGENSIIQMDGVPLSMRGYKYADGDTGVSSVRFDKPWQTNIAPHGRWEVVRING